MGAGLTVGYDGRDRDQLGVDRREVGQHAVEVGGVVDLTDEAGDAGGGVVAGEVVEQRAEDASAGPSPDHDLVGGGLEHGSTVRRIGVTAPHLIAHLTRVNLVGG